MKIITGLMAVLLLTGCATMFSKSHYQVPVISTPPAHVTITDKRTGDVVMTGETPFTAELNSNYSYGKAAKYIVSAETEGYVPQEKFLHATMSAWILMDIIIIDGGLISVLCFDMPTGRMWNLDKEVGFLLIKK